MTNVILLQDVIPYRQEELGEGRFAKIYRLQDFHLPEVNFSLAYKLYKKAHPPVSSLALRSIPAVRERLAESKRLTFDELTAWPLRVVVDASNPDIARGIIMRQIPKSYFFELSMISGRSKTKLRDLGFAIQSEADCINMGTPFMTTMQRLTMLESLANVLSLLHRPEIGIIYGDLSLKNAAFRVSKSGFAEIILIDCDAVLRAGTSSAFGHQPHSPGFVPPEAAKSLHDVNSRSRTSMAANQAIGNWHRQTVATDTYKFGLIVLRVMDPGRHASQNFDPSVALEKLPIELSKMLTASLESTPADRPQMDEWYRGLAQVCSVQPISRVAAATRSSESLENSRRNPIPGWKKVRPGEWVRTTRHEP